MMIAERHVPWNHVDTMPMRFGTCCSMQNGALLHRLLFGKYSTRNDIQSPNYKAAFLQTGSEAEIQATAQHHKQMMASDRNTHSQNTESLVCDFFVFESKDS
jgi:hypothetical protein